MAVQPQPKKLLGYGPDGMAYYSSNGVYMDGNGKILNYKQIPTGLTQNNPVSSNPSKPVETIPGTNISTASDRGTIEQEASREKQQTLDAVNQAAALRTQGIGMLGDFLTKHNQAQFNYDLPGIKEDLAWSGLFSSPSALAAAVSRESGMLGANTQSVLSQAGLGNIDLQAEGLLGATSGAQQLQQGGLQRQFSVFDYDKQAQLARDIGAMSVPNAPGFSITGALGGATSGGLAGAPLGPAGIAAGAIGGGLLGGSKSGGGSFICTHLKNMGYMTQEEVNQVHAKIFTSKFRHFYSLFAYSVLAPLFIVRASLIDYPWKELKKEMCDDVLACETSEEAFEKYKSNGLKHARPIFPRLCNFFFGKAVSYGY